MLFRYGHLPIAPVLGDEVIINDASISLAQGHGYAARSFADSKYGLDQVFAHFPPLYPYTEALAFHVFGVSVYSLRLTTTVMSLLTTVFLFFLVRQLCRVGLMSWDVGLLVNAIYGTNTSMIAFDRTARMESMIGFLVMLSLFAVFLSATMEKGRRTWPLTVLAGVAGALSVAVHPEAGSALILLGGLILVLTPGGATLKLVSVGSFVIVPAVVGFLIFGPHLLITAVHQFLSIAHDASATEPSSSQRIMELLQSHSLTALNRVIFLESIILLLLIVPVGYFWVTRGLPHSSLRFRLTVCVAVVGILELLLMVFVFRMVDRRFQFLFGPLLVCDALCLLGAARLRTWQSILGWGVVCVQCVAAGVYLSGRGHSQQAMNPDRYLPLVRSLPPGISIASTPGLWLDFQENHRPFTLIYFGLDGENVWSAKDTNALDRFDAIILEDSYSLGMPWWKQLAQAGRVRYVYTIGDQNVAVYLRKGVPFQP